MSGSKPKLKVRTLDAMFKKISESSENDKHKTDIMKICNALFVIFHQQKFFV
jgi:hypothetical protein